jgi:16S rRNA (guanine527-N7)-methyltransferase
MDISPADEPPAPAAVPPKQPSATLETALDRHSVALASHAIPLLSSYCQLLWDWNTRLNLTRHLDYDTFVTRDLADTVALAQFMCAGEQVLDVGTGGGVPGIVLAVIRPDLRIAVCESIQKKVACLQQIVASLGIPVEVHAGRAEQILPHFQFQTLTVRGVARLDQLLKSFKASWNYFDRMLLVKGPRWVEERAAARHVGLLQSLELRKLCTYRSGDAPSFILQLRRKPTEASPPR